jgi:hypothetical protein
VLAALLSIISGLNEDLELIGAIKPQSEKRVWVYGKNLGQIGVRFN